MFLFVVSIHINFCFSHPPALPTIWKMSFFLFGTLIGFCCTWTNFLTRYSLIVFSRSYLYHLTNSFITCPVCPNFATHLINILISFLITSTHFLPDLSSIYVTILYTDQISPSYMHVDWPMVHMIILSQTALLFYLNWCHF